MQQEEAENVIPKFKLQEDEIFTTLQSISYYHVFQKEKLSTREIKERFEDHLAKKKYIYIVKNPDLRFTLGEDNILLAIEFKNLFLFYNKY